MKDACEGKRASLLIRFVSACILVFFIAACNNSKHYSTHYIHMQDGLIYKQGNSEPYTGRIQDTLQNKIIVYDVVNGKKHGEFYVSLLNGDVSIYGFVENNKNVGTWNYFYETGELESKGNFRDDRPHGKWLWFYQNGKIKCEGYFINGREIGRWKSYNEKGSIISIVTYSNGEKTNEIIFSRQLKI